MTSDEQEARSRAHDTVGITVRRLKSGRFALYDQWGRFVADCTYDYLPYAITGMFREYELFSTMPRYADQPSKKAAALAELEAIGL